MFTYYFIYRRSLCKSNIFQPFEVIGEPFFHNQPWRSYINICCIFTILFTLLYFLLYFLLIHPCTTCSLYIYIYNIYVLFSFFQDMYLEQSSQSSSSSPSDIFFYFTFRKITAIAQELLLSDSVSDIFILMYVMSQTHVSY